MSFEDVPFWESVGFHERLLAWIDLDSPEHAVIVAVIDWIDRQTRHDPYRGVRRQADIASNLWWGRIPGTVRAGTAVFCSYWIYEDLRRVRCDSISTLSC